MSDEKKKEDPKAPQQASAQQPIRLTIVYDGVNVGVQGPIGNKILCLGMLKLAEQSIMDYAPQPKAPAIPVVPANAMPPAPGRPN